MPTGGLSHDRARWIPSHKKFLVPVQALSSIFRTKFVSLLREALPQCTLPESIWTARWVVYRKPTVQGVDKVLTYLARYVHRMAITNGRILAVDDQTVTFRYRDSRDQRTKTMTLPGDEFLRRFLEHVLPEGFHKVRIQSTNFEGVMVYSKGKLITEGGEDRFYFLVSSKRAL